MRVGDAILMRTQVFCHVYGLRQAAAYCLTPVGNIKAGGVRRA